MNDFQESGHSRQVVDVVACSFLFFVEIGLVFSVPDHRKESTPARSRPFLRVCARLANQVNQPILAASFFHIIGCWRS